MFLAFLLGKISNIYKAGEKKGQRIKLVLISKRDSAENRLAGNVIYGVSTGWAVMTFRRWIKAFLCPASGCVNY